MDVPSRCAEQDHSGKASLTQCKVTASTDHALGTKYITQCIALLVLGIKTDVLCEMEWGPAAQAWAWKLSVRPSIRRPTLRSSPLVALGGGSPSLVGHDAAAARGLTDAYG